MGYPYWKGEKRDMKLEYKGDILTVRGVEDAIRVTKKYTKGAFRRPVQHPIQGEEFPSRLLVEYYEVYPFVEVDWNMLSSNFWSWIFGNVVCIDVRFQYDYRNNTAVVVIRGGPKSINHLCEGIPGFGNTIQHLEGDKHDRRYPRDHQEMAVGKPDRSGTGAAPDTQRVVD